MAPLQTQRPRRPIYGVLPRLRKVDGLWTADLPPFPQPFTSLDHYETRFRWIDAMAWCKRQNHLTLKLRALLNQSPA